MRDSLPSTGSGRPGFWLLPAVFTLFLLSGCAEDQTVLERQVLFSLPVGMLETQFDSLGYGTAAPRNKNRIVMRNDIIGISNGVRNKIMEFTSYGDLLSMYYHPQQNPKPITLLEDSPEQQQRRLINKKAHPYTFQEIGEIAYTSSNTLLVEDHVPDSRRFYDEQAGVNLRHVVVRFDESGRYRDYLGQEGIGGTPFPVIEDIQVNRDDHSIVISKTPDAHQVFWFNQQGDRLYSLEFTTQTLPGLGDQGLIPTIDRIVPAASGPFLFLHINYYPESREGSEGDQEYVQSIVYRFNIAQEQYDRSFPLPLNLVQPPGTLSLSGTEVQYLFHLVGLDAQGRFFFISPSLQDQHRVIVMDSQGRVVYRSFIAMSDDRILFRDLSVTPRGILISLQVYNDRTEVVWWRSDQALDS